MAGRETVQNLDEATILIAQPGSLAATFNGYRGRFGDGFHQRAMENPVSQRGSVASLLRDGRSCRRICSAGGRDSEGGR